MNPTRIAVSATLLLALAACGETAKLPVSAGTGSGINLPPPTRTLIPTINVATATGWPAGSTPVAAPGMAVAPFGS